MGARRPLELDGPNRLRGPGGLPRGRLRMLPGRARAPGAMFFLTPS